MIRPRHRGRRKLLGHVRAHEAVIGNETWYGDSPPSLGKAFTAKKTANRHVVVLQDHPASNPKKNSEGRQQAARRARMTVYTTD